MATAAAAAERRTSILPLFVAVLLIPAVLGSSQTIFNDGDVSWHIATGQWILDHWAIPTSDPFSFTWAGKPWVPIEWLAEVLYAGAYRLAGYSGVAALVTAALIALHAIVYMAGRSSRAGLLAIVAMDFVLVPMMLARPHLLTWPLLAGWTWLMIRAREEGRAPPLWTALLMTLWANLHGGFVFGLAIAAAFGLEALVASEDKARAFREWLLFGLVCAVAVCINGNGFHGVIHPLQFTSLEMLPLIAEWKRSNPSVTPFFFGVLAVVAALIAWKRPRMHPVRWLLLGAFLAAALLQVRHQSVLAIVAAMILPRAFATSAEPQSVQRSALALLVAAAAGLVLVRGGMPLRPAPNEANPWQLIAAVPPELRTQPVINNYSMGGPLILSGIRPYVDGRGDMYGDALVVDYAKIMSGDRKRFERAVNEWDIRWAIIGNSNGKFAALLDAHPQWRRIHRGDVGSIYARMGSSGG